MIERLITQILLFAPICTYILSAVLSLFSDKKSYQYIICTLGPFIGLFSVIFITANFKTFIYKFNLVDITDTIQIYFKIDGLGIAFALLCTSLSVPACFYAVSYINQTKENNQPRFFFYFYLSIATTIALAFSGNLITLFVFYEFLTLFTYPLVTHSKTPNAQKAGATYISYLMLSSLVLLFPAIVIILNTTGTLEFTKSLLLAEKNPWAKSIILILFAFGTAKAGLMPLHRWLPAAMVAPTPVSALLHAVAVVKSGVFCIIKFCFYAFCTQNFASMPENILIYVAGCTVLVASIIACQKTQLKEVLAYSTISQLSYMVMTASMLTPDSVKAALAYMFIHGFAKITLFFAAGAIYIKTKQTSLEGIKGIGRRMPITAIAFCIGALAMIGLPPTSAFFGKMHIFSVAVLEQQYFVIFVLIVSTGLNTLYFLPIVLDIFAKKNTHNCSEASFFITAPLCITALFTVGLFFYCDRLLILLNHL